ncbi:MAG TPA: UpxY family transcription antiterminator [Terriglobales bacterium]|nr:UpxY family transcription antiterminator [Terriglobales bacterium]
MLAGQPWDERTSQRAVHANRQPQDSESHWYAAYTLSRHEKQVARQLEERCLDYFLPLYKSVRRWKDRRRQVELPLFPSYVFIRIALKDRLRVLTLPSVVQFVSFNGRPAQLPESEIAALRSGLAGNLVVEPHPYLKVGRRVRVRSGAFAGMEGILRRKKERFRIVLCMDLIMRSMAVEVDESDIEPTF